ncbi:MAG TPA: cytochrome P450 [Gemmatimonadaceae bacterium]|nr:cytochrome P450 [Gemmatimonadaceae bacterium]
MTVARRLPETRAGDLLRLCLTLAGGLLRRPRAFSIRQGLRSWTRDTGVRYGSADFIVRVGSKTFVVVGSQSFSDAILAVPPREAGISAGNLKRGGMQFLAPQALTITNDEQWQRLRALNEEVLEPGRLHDDERAFLAAVRRAFTEPVRNAHDVRSAMSRAMVDIVFGPGVAPASIGHDVSELFGYVQSPLKRALLAPVGKRRRARFRAELARACDAAASSSAPSLAGRAARGAHAVSRAELLDQVPHWMFTFTRSGTELLVRALALVCAHPDARDRVRAEVAALGRSDSPGQSRALAFASACVREAAYLYPPVTRTFHRASEGAVAGGVAIPAGAEIASSLPPVEVERAGPRRFDPARWLAPSGGPTDFDPFLTGPRRCPGRDLISLVCAVALAELVARQDLTLARPRLVPNDLPVELSGGSVRFRAG